MLKNLIKLFFPELCRGCKSLLLKNENLLCSSCRYDLPFTHHHKIKQNDTEKKINAYREMPKHCSALLEHLHLYVFKYLRL